MKKDSLCLELLLNYRSLQSLWHVFLPKWSHRSLFSLIWVKKNSHSNHKIKYPSILFRFIGIFWLSSNALIELLLETCPAFSKFIMPHIFFNRNLISSTITNEIILLQALHWTNTSLLILSKLFYRGKYDNSGLFRQFGNLFSK